MTKTSQSLFNEIKSSVTVKQKILLHLMRFNCSPDTGFNVAYDLTQDGIAGVVGITRAHVSVELKRMVEDGRLVSWKAHMPGSSIKRLAYALSSTGLSEAKEVEAYLLSNGIIPDMLLDMQRCNPGDLWNTLNEADRDVLGMACVLRRRIPRADLPRMSGGTLPVDQNGNVAFPPAAAKNYLTYASPSRVRTWHSWAADYWLSAGEYQERLYHLTMAGRMKEAGRCVSLHRDELLDRSDISLLRTLKRVLPEPENAVDVFALGAEVALRLDEINEAGRMCARLASVSELEWRPLMAEVCRREGKTEEARKLALEALDIGPDAKAALVLARIALDEGDADAAEAYGDQAALAVSHTGNSRELQDLHSLRNDTEVCRRN